MLLVFNKVGARDPVSSMKATAQHCRRHWAGEWQGDHHTYDDKIPIVATTMDLLREHGPAGEAFWRFGRPDWQCLTDAIGNPARPPKPNGGRPNSVRCSNARRRRRPGGRWSGGRCVPDAALGSPTPAGSTSGR